MSSALPRVSRDRTVLPVRGLVYRLSGARPNSMRSAGLSFGTASILSAARRISGPSGIDSSFHNMNDSRALSRRLSLRLFLLPLSLGALSVFAGTPLQTGCASQCIALLGFVRIHIRPSLFSFPCVGLLLILSEVLGH